MRRGFICFCFFVKYKITLGFSIYFLKEILVQSIGFCIVCCTYLLANISTIPYNVNRRIVNLADSFMNAPERIFFMIGKKSNLNSCYVGDRIFLDGEIELFISFMWVPEIK